MERKDGIQKLFDNRLLKIKDLSRFLAIAEGTIRDWVYKRKIPYLKIGHNVRFRPSDIKIWLEERRV